MRSYACQSSIFNIGNVLDTSSQTCDTGSGKLQYFVLFRKTLDQRIDLAVITGKFNDQILRTYINDLRTEIVGKEFYPLANLQTLFGIYFHLDQYQFAVHAVIRVQFLNIPDIHKLSHLLLDLFQNIVISRCHNGDSGKTQTVLPVCKNNLYVAASDGFFADGSNKAVNFDSDVIFAATEQNPWDEGDESYNHQTSVLSGDMKVAMIAENSIALGAGIAVVDGVEIPTVDQLGNARPATPSVGAVEYSSLSGITGNVKDVVRIWNSGNIVYATGLNKAATAKVYSMTGGLVYEGIIANHSALELPIEEGVYLIVVDKAIQKLIIK